MSWSWAECISHLVTMILFHVVFRIFASAELQQGGLCGREASKGLLLSVKDNDS